MSFLAGKDAESVLGGVDNLSDYSDEYDGDGVNLPYHYADELKENLKPEKSKKKKFRFSAMSVFLTYPQCDMSRSECLSYLQGKLGCVKEAAICMEKHKDGNPHLHAYIGFSKRVNYRNCSCFDINNFHPHISNIRSLPGVLRYIMKEDKEVLSFNIDLKKFSVCADKKVSTSFLVGSMILEGASVLEIIQRYPSWATRIPQLVSSVNMYKSLKSSSAYGIRNNFCAFWIYGNAGIGKSFSIRKIAGDDAIYFKSFNSKYWDGYDNEKHKVVVFDDYHGDAQVPFADLKRIADAYPYYVDMKGITQVAAKYIVFIITSNYSLEECCINSKKTSKQIVEPMKRRFIEVNANDYICGDFFNFQYFLDKNCLSFYVDDWKTKYPDWFEDGLNYYKCVDMYRRSLKEKTSVRKLLGLSETDHLEEKSFYSLWDMWHYDSKYGQFVEDKKKRENELKINSEEYQ